MNIGPLQQTTQTDSNGYWQFNLIPNPALTPTGTSYTIETPYNSYSVSVPNSTGPFQSSSILVNVPSIISPALTGLTGPITVTGNETITGNLTVSGTSSLDGTTTGALSATANSGVSGDWTILSPGRLVFTALAGKIVPGATSISHRNNADSADNLLITDAGAVTIRNGLTVVAGGGTISSGVFSVPFGGLLIALAGSAGPPTSGTYSVGQVYTDSGGATFICTTAGTPGTWSSFSTGKYHAEVHLSTNQSIPNSTSTILNFDTIDGDPNGSFNTSTHLYTCPVAGRYLVTSSSASLATATGTAAANVFKNGSEFFRSSGQQVSAAFIVENFAAVVRCASGDTLAAGVVQTTGGAITFSNSIAQTWAQYTYLGPN